MYDSFIPLSQARETAFRIFDPYSYKATSVERFVPVCLGECFDLAPVSPLVWRPNQVGALELVAVRSLRLEQKVAPPAQAGLRNLPLLLQAYPFRFRRFEKGDTEIGLERVLPSFERDQGSYVYNFEGILEAGAEMKISALETFLDGMEDLRWITQILSDADAFEPVQLPDEVVARHKLPDMWAARDDLELENVLHGCAPDKIARMVRFLTAQRLSLYRMGAVMAASE